MKELWLVMGFGRSGIAAADLLIKLDKTPVIIDDVNSEQMRLNAEKYRNAGIIVLLGVKPEQLTFVPSYAVISPGIPLNHWIFNWLTKHHISPISEVELGWQNTRGTLIAISGSNGKTTTTKLLGEIFAKTRKRSFTCGNIGIAISSVALETDDDSLLSVEVSSFQLMHIQSFNPKVAVLINITPDHLKEHDGFENYKKAKERLWLNHSEDNYLIYNYDDVEVKELVKSAKSRKIPISTRSVLSEGSWIEDGVFRCKLSSIGIDWDFNTEQFALKGRHNFENALCAITAAFAAGVDCKSVERGLMEFRGVPHRQELIRIINGVSYINDSKSTNVDSGIIALETMAKPVILIAGGISKEAGFSKVEAIVRSKVKHLIALGKCADDLVRDLKGSTKIDKVRDISEAVFLASQIAQDGDIVLLSPMAASFDMFDNYEHRGNVFRELVNALSISLDPDVSVRGLL